MSNYSLKDTQKFLSISKRLNLDDASFDSLYEDILKRGKHRTAMLYFDEDDRLQKVSYREMGARVELLSRHLNGLLSFAKKGSVIALKIKNCENWPVLFWSLLKCGYSVLLIDARLAFENTENLLSQAKVSAIIAAEEKPYSVPLFRLNDILGSNEKELEAKEPFGKEVLFCSSGTTGEAKIMAMDARNLLSQIQSATNLPSYGNNTIMHPGRAVALAMVPFHHIFGFVAVFLWYSFYSKTLLFPTSQGSRDLLKAIKKGKATHVYSVPLFWDGVAQNIERSFALKGPKKEKILQKFVAYNVGEISASEAGALAWGPFRWIVKNKILGNHIEWCISGGGYLQSKTLRLLNGLGYPLANGYGMTELGVASVEASTKVKDRLLGSIGKGFEGFSFKIAPTGDPKKEEGELLIKSETVHKREIVGGSERKTILKDGYFPTGDIAYIDENGRIFIKGRIKDTIISSNGENVYPDEIESYFVDLPHVLSLAALGVQNGNKEEIYLVFDLDNSITEEELKAFKVEVDRINGTLPSEKKISKALISRKPLPLSSSMKIKRFALKNDILKNPGDFYDFDQSEKTAVSFDEFDEKEVLETLSAVRSVFSKTLLLPEFKIGNDDVWNGALGGDSMSYVTMVSDLDSFFGITIPVELYGKLGTVKDFAHEVLVLKNSKKSEPNGKKDVATPSA